MSDNIYDGSYHYQDICPNLPDFTLVTEEIHKVIKDEAWQRLRVSLKGKSTYIKLQQCSLYIKSFDEGSSDEARRRANVQVMNYLNALKRGGQLTAEGMVQR